MNILKKILFTFIALNGIGLQFSLYAPPKKTTASTAASAASTAASSAATDPISSAKEQEEAMPSSGTGYISEPKEQEEEEEEAITKQQGYSLAELQKMTVDELPVANIIGKKAFDTNSHAKAKGWDRGKYYDSLEIGEIVLPTGGQLFYGIVVSEYTGPRSEWASPNLKMYNIQTGKKFVRPSSANHLFRHTPPKIAK